MFSLIQYFFFDKTSCSSVLCHLESLCRCRRFIPSDRQKPFSHHCLISQWSSICFWGFLEGKKCKNFSSMILFSFWKLWIEREDEVIGKMEISISEAQTHIFLKKQTQSSFILKTSQGLWMLSLVSLISIIWWNTKDILKIFDSGDIHSWTVHCTEGIVIFQISKYIFSNLKKIFFKVREHLL